MPTDAGIEPRTVATCALAVSNVIKKIFAKPFLANLHTNIKKITTTGIYSQTLKFYLIFAHGYQKTQNFETV